MKGLRFSGRKRSRTQCVPCWCLVLVLVLVLSRGSHIYALLPSTSIHPTQRQIQIQIFGAPNNEDVETRNRARVGK